MISFLVTPGLIRGDEESIAPSKGNRVTADLVALDIPE
jgi:hypothetical protein